MRVCINNQTGVGVSAPDISAPQSCVGRDGFTNFGEIQRNGDFQETTEWLFGTGWAITGGQAVKSVLNTIPIRQEYDSPPLLNGQTYRLTIIHTRSSASGVLYVSSGGFGGSTVSLGGGVGGETTIDIVCADQTKSLRFSPSGDWLGAIDNVKLEHIGRVGGW